MVYDDDEKYHDVEYYDNVDDEEKIEKIIIELGYKHVAITYLNVSRFVFYSRYTRTVRYIIHTLF